MRFKILFISISFICLFLGVESNVDFKVATTKEELPHSSSYFHVFANNYLYTRTVAPTIQFYAVFSTFPSTTTTVSPNPSIVTDDSIIKNGNLRPEKIIEVRYDEAACLNGDSQLYLQFGVCNYTVSFASDVGLEACVYKINDKDNESNSTYYKESNSNKYVDIPKDKFTCGVMANAGEVDNSEHMANTVRIPVKIQINRPSTGIQVKLRDAMYGYSDNNTPDLIMFVILCALFIIALILLVACIIAVRLNHLFIKPKFVAPDPIFQPNLLDK